MLENELFAFLEGTTDAAFSVSQQGEILSWNVAAHRLFGYSSSEVLGKSCSQILHGRGVLGTKVCQEGCSILECTGGRTEIPNFDLQVRLHSGKRLWVNLSTVVWKNPRNQHHLVIHLAHDITRQKDSGTSDREDAADVPSIQQSCRRTYASGIPRGRAFRTRVADSEAILVRKKLS